MLVSIYQTTWHHIPEYHDLNYEFYEICFHSKSRGDFISVNEKDAKIQTNVIWDLNLPWQLKLMTSSWLSVMPVG
jgi:hypothetical protein